MKNMMVALVALALLPAVSFAGGGSKGVNTTIRVVNNGSNRLAVIVDAPAGFDPKKNTVSQFTAAGGKIIEVGGTLDVKAKSGDHKFGASFVSDSGVIGRNATEKKSIPTNSTVTATVLGNFPFAPTVTYSSTTTK